MAYELRYSRKALKQLKKLPRFDQVIVLDEIEERLSANPTQTSTAFRVFHDVDGSSVDIVHVLSKEDAIAYFEDEFPS